MKRTTWFFTTLLLTSTAFAGSNYSERITSGAVDLSDSSCTEQSLKTSVRNYLKAANHEILSTTVGHAVSAEVASGSTVFQVIYAFTYSDSGRLKSQVGTLNLQHKLDHCSVVSDMFTDADRVDSAGND